MILHAWAWFFDWVSATAAVHYHRITISNLQCSHRSIMFRTCRNRLDSKHKVGESWFFILVLGRPLKHCFAQLSQIAFMHLTFQDLRDIFSFLKLLYFYCNFYTNINTILKHSLRFFWCITRCDLNFNIRRLIKFTSRIY